MLNQRTLNTEVLDAAAALPASFIGKLISIDQVVQNVLIGTLISISQNVKSFTVASANTIFSIEQSVYGYEVNTVISIAQNVQVAGSNTFFNRNGYDVDIFIGGYQVPKSQITDKITIKKKEDTSSELKFTIIPALGAQSPENFQGQPVYVNLTNSSGVVCRNFTGYIDTPSMDLIEKKIEFTCTDRRDTRILGLPYTYIKAIGSYSKDIFGDPKDQGDELSKRLSTTPQSFDFDNYGNPQLTPWLPKVSADIVLSGSKIFYDKPEVTYTNRTKTINTINIDISYKHQRLHEQLANVSWPGYDNFLTDWFNVGSPSFPQRSTILSAAQSQSWAPVTPVVFTPLWPAGGFGNVNWNPNKVVNTYVPVQTYSFLPYVDPVTGIINSVWPDGKMHAAMVDVLDASGKVVFTVATTTVTDTSTPLCRGAQWTAGKKFAQNVTELYSLKFTSPQAISRFGTIDAHETYHINDPYDTSVWTNDKQLYAATNTPSTATGAWTNGIAYLKGATTLVLAAVGSGSLTTNSVITLLGDPSNSYYTIVNGTTNVGAGGTITIKAPGLAANLFAQGYQVIPAPASLSATNNFFIDQKPLYSTLQLALDVACNKAQTTILKAHRDVFVKFRRLIWPEADLTHTIQTTATQVATIGKLSSLVHTIDVQTGEAYSDCELQLSRSFGGDSQSVYNITVPPVEDTTYIGNPMQVTLQTHYGINPSVAVTPLAITWNGYIGNTTISGTVNTGGGTTNWTSSRTDYPESFTVDYPAILPVITQDRTITTALPGTSTGATTDSAGYLSGVTLINLAAAGSGSILQGDTVSFAGDSSNGIYVVQADILDVSLGGILTISPGLGAALSGTTHAITLSPPANNFVVAIPNNSLTVTF